METIPDPEVRTRLDEQLRLAALAAKLTAGCHTPYFAHLRLQTDRGVRDLLLGTRTATSAGVALVDWRKAPLAELFFRCREGESWELEVDARTLAGRVLWRHLVGFDAAGLCTVETNGVVLARGAGGAWAVRPTRAPATRLRPIARRVPSGGPVVKLDEGQRRLVELPPDRSLLVLGEAGFGKTTVALHRLAHLRTQAGPGFRAAVLVPTEGLRRLSAVLLERLGAADVEALTVDAFARRAARAAFPLLPPREVSDAPGAVVALKRHPALRVALEALAPAAPPRLDDEEPDALLGARVRRADLQQLFGDRALLEEVARGYGGA
ncbi:MAG: hypothetical protein ACK4N5_17775, partial [Myxococcales bacterium]